jgi:hypothetical protein
MGLKTYWCHAKCIFQIRADARVQSAQILDALRCNSVHTDCGSKATKAAMNKLANPEPHVSQLPSDSGHLKTLGKFANFHNTVSRNMAYRLWK